MIAQYLGILTGALQISAGLAFTGYGDWARGVIFLSCGAATIATIFAR